MKIAYLAKSFVSVWRFVLLEMRMYDSNILRDQKAALISQVDTCEEWQILG